MPARKRVIEEVDEEDTQDIPPPTSPFLDKLRNMWEFANLMQYIYIFGGVVKISQDVDIEILEMECCKPSPSEVLSQIGLALLKFVSSHRGLTPDLFDEYARRQYDAKAPDQENPFGKDEEPLKFVDFDVFLKIRILHQLSVWTLFNPDRIRQALANANEKERSWYVEPFGWDNQDRTYYSLDDNRLYRMTDLAVIEPPKQKKLAKAVRPKAKGLRSSKRQKLSNGTTGDDEAEDVDENDVTAEPNEEVENHHQGLGLGGARWECVAITLKDYKDFTESIRRSKDPNEKALHKRMVQEMIPVIEEIAAVQERKAAQRRRELENLEKLATAKRSSRIAVKHEKLKEQQDAEEAERKNQEELGVARREQETQKKMEAAREARIMTREKRLKDRELKRILHEEELGKLESQSQSGDSADARISERRRKNELERKKRELEEWKETEYEWYFDCSICGVHGKNLDDGSHILACDKCNVWQHSACHNIKDDEADRDDFHFVCATCQKPPRPIKLNMDNDAASPQGKKAKKRQPKQQNQPNDNMQVDAKKRKKIPKAQQSHLNGPTPPLAPPYRPTSQHDPVVLIPVNSQNPQPESKSYYPAQGHFPPPINGFAPRTTDASLSHQEARFSPTTGGLGSFASTTASSSPYLPGANGVQNNASSVVWRNQKSPSGFSYTKNDFARQRISPHSQPSASHNLHEHQGSLPYSSVPISRPDSSQGSQLPTRHAAPFPPIAASPTPSFSATQGNTDVRFTPTHLNNGPINSMATLASPGSNSYVPNSNQSNASAVSPMKQSSSPPLPLPQSSLQSQDRVIVSAGAPAFQSTSTASKAGISPIKHDNAPIVPPLPFTAGLGVTGVAAGVKGLLGPTSPHGPHTTLIQSHPHFPQVQSIGHSNQDSNALDNISTPFTSTTKPSGSMPSPSTGMRPVVEPAQSTYSLQLPQPAQDQIDHKPIRMNAVPPAPTLSPSAGLTRVVESPEKKASPQPLQPPKYDLPQSNILPPALVLSPSVVSGGAVETPEKKHSPLPSFEAEHLPEKTIPHQLQSGQLFAFAAGSDQTAKDKTGD